MVRRVKDQSSSMLCRPIPPVHCVVLVAVWARLCERGGVALCGGRWVRARLGGGSGLACGGDGGTSYHIES